MRKTCSFILCISVFCGVPLAFAHADSEEPSSQETLGNVDTFVSPYWCGEQFRSITSRTIMRRVQQLTDFSWSPAFPIHNWAGGYDGKAYYDFVPDKIYRGMPYTNHTMDGPDQNRRCTYHWPSFLDAVSKTTGGEQQYGTNAFGFVSISLGLERLYDQFSLVCDAMYQGRGCDLFGTTDDDSIHMLGPTGSADRANYQQGDLLIYTEYPSAGRTKIVESSISGGVRVSEEMPGRASNGQTYLWRDLVQFMPARRNHIVDSNYVPMGSWTVNETNYGTWSDISANQNGIYVVDNQRVLQYSSTGNLLWLYALNAPRAVVASSSMIGVLRTSPLSSYRLRRYPEFEEYGICPSRHLLSA